MFFRRKPDPVRTVVLDPEGFCFREDEQTVYRFEWTAVREIVAFKRDLFAYDEICLGFRIDDTDRYVEVWESDHGYRELLSALPDHYSRIRSDWLPEVVQPPFVTKRTTVWNEGQRVSL